MPVADWVSSATQVSTLRHTNNAPAHCRELWSHVPGSILKDPSLLWREETGELRNVGFHVTTGASRQTLYS